MSEEPNAALLMAFSGQSKEATNSKVTAQRQETLNTLRIQHDQREREEKRLAGIAKAQEARRNRNAQKVSTSGS